MVEYRTDTFTTAAAVTKGHFVKLNGSGLALHCAADSDQAIGVAIDSADSGDDVLVCLEGPCKVRVADATPSIGDYIGHDSSGRATAWAGDDGDEPINGVFLQAGKASSGGEYALVEALVFGRKTSAETQLRTLDISVGAESADVIELTLTQAPTAAGKWECVITNNNGVEDATAYHLGATTGTEESATDQARLVVTATAAGSIVLEATDVVGGSDANAHVFLYPLDSPGVIYHQEITFDAS